ncbi:hypothetical protein BGZ65_007558 [Modicella reniformis]|uniref:Uncharacterized protein n=1 Tax=Modicella reniformis TaxID=1440133 RepID=A0A9P6LXI7_9FUNG|nr:hypothetical protein BGZ65_007558 [Modicella reniformis]
MRFTTPALGLAFLIITVSARCDEPPGIGQLDLFAGSSCGGMPFDVDALDTCKNNVGFRACSAMTKTGYTCDIFGSNGCYNDLIARVHFSGSYNFCGGKSSTGTTVQSAKCRKG